MRLIDADTAAAFAENCGATFVGKRLRDSNAFPEVVTRCKECKHAERYERTDGTIGYYCGHPQNTFTYGERWDRVFKPAKEADDFCSYGERREANHA